MSDALDTAIASAAKPPAQARFQAQLGIGPGRVALVDVPADITDAELLVLVTTLTREARGELMARRPASRLLVPVRRPA